MLDRTQLRATLRKPLEGLTGLPLMLWEGRAIKPNGAIHVVEQLIPIYERLNGSNTLESLGYIQYTVMVPDGTGTEKIEEIAQLIAEQYKPATSIQGEVTVHLERTERPALIQGVNGYTAQPVRIQWRSFAVNRP